MIRDNDRRATITHPFIVGHEVEVVVRAVGPDGVEEARESATRATIVIKGKLDTPSAPTSLATDGYLNAILLTWVNPLDYDVRHVEVWRAATDNRAVATKIAEVKGITYIDAIGLADTIRYYWVRAINTSGLASDFTDSVSGTSLGVVATDIDDFAVTATKMFTKAIILNADVWTNDTPNPGANTHISWNAHSIVYNGASYPIAAGNTALKYVYWTIGDATYSDSATHPTLGTTAFMIAINTAGIHTLVWNSSANMVIGTAFIESLIVGTNVAIGSAEDAAGVTTIVGNTITTGYVDALEITVLGAVTAGSLTGLLIRTDTGAAGHYKRIELDVSDNTLRMYDASNNNVITMDDDISGYAGIHINSDTGIIKVRKDANNIVDIYNHRISVIGSEDVATIRGIAMGSLSSRGVISATFNTGLTGNLFYGELESVEKFAVDHNGNLTLTGTTDGRDIDTDGTKLDTIDTDADVTADNFPKSHSNTHHLIAYQTSANVDAKILTHTTVNAHHDESHTIASHSDKVRHDDMVQTYGTATLSFTDNSANVIVLTIEDGVITSIDINP